MCTLNAQVGVINAMRTGNVVLDMMIAMSIPLALQAFFKFWEWLKPRIEEFVLSFQRQDFYFVRSIDHVKVRLEIPWVRLEVHTDRSYCWCWVRLEVHTDPR